MKRLMLEAAADLEDAQELRREIQETDGADMHRRKRGRRNAAAERRS